MPHIQGVSLTDFRVYRNKGALKQGESNESWLVCETELETLVQLCVMSDSDAERLSCGCEKCFLCRKGCLLAIPLRS